MKKDIKIARLKEQLAEAKKQAKEAKAEAHELITMQGRCPIDLVKHLFANGMVPDAALPWDDSRRALLDNWDFLARFYLQSFYRAK